LTAGWIQGVFGIEAKRQDGDGGGENLLDVRGKLTQARAAHRTATGVREAHVGSW